MLGDSNGGTILSVIGMAVGTTAGTNEDPFADANKIGFCHNFFKKTLRCIKTSHDIS